MSTRTGDPRALLFLSTLLLLADSGCSRQQDAHHPLIDPAAASQVTDQEIEMLRLEVRQQTDHLKKITMALQVRSESGRQIDREVLLRIENQVSRAQSRVQRIEAILDRIESNQR
ncbi:MAG: hypothetical protein VX764_03120 [Planctomycetota bacterium]|nr:hypothetical protein [Planctomycetota bacterium]